MNFYSLVSFLILTIKDYKIFKFKLFIQCFRFFIRTRSIFNDSRLSLGNQSTTGLFFQINSNDQFRRTIKMNLCLLVYLSLSSKSVLKQWKLIIPSYVWICMNFFISLKSLSVVLIFVAKKNWLQEHGLPSILPPIAIAARYSILVSWLLFWFARWPGVMCRICEFPFNPQILSYCFKCNGGYFDWAAPLFLNSWMECPYP